MSSLNIKPGVILVMRPCLEPIIAAAQNAFFSQNADCTITSGVEACGVEAVRLMRSKHPSGEALDWRISHLPRKAEQASMIAALMKKELGNDYDVVVKATHIHSEYDPK